MDCGFSPYKKTGLFGFYIKGDSLKGPEMFTLIISYVKDLLNELTDEEIRKARSMLFGELMMLETGNDLT